MDCNHDIGLKGVFMVQRAETKTNRWGNIYHTLRFRDSRDIRYITQVFKPELLEPFKGFLPTTGTVLYMELWEDEQPDDRTYLRPCMIRPATPKEEALFMAQIKKEPETIPTSNKESEAQPPDRSREAVISRSVTVTVVVQYPDLPNWDPGTQPDRRAYEEARLKWVQELFKISDIIKAYIESGQPPKL